MFTTGNHLYLYAALGLYALTLITYFMKFRGAFWILIAGLIINSLYLLGRGWLGGVFIPNPIFEGPFLLSWCVAFIAVIMKITRKNDDWGILIIPLLLFSLFAVYHAKGMIPPTPKKMTVWALAFFFTETMAHACFYCGAVIAIIFLSKNNHPSFHSLIIWGFMAFSVSQVVGAIWCYMGWGNTFRWGPRHMTSAAIWLIYAAYLHLRFLPAWDMRRRAWYAVTAAFIVFVSVFKHYLHEMVFPRIGG